MAQIDVRTAVLVKEGDSTLLESCIVAFPQSQNRQNARRNSTKQDRLSADTEMQSSESKTEAASPNTAHPLGQVGSMHAEQESAVSLPESAVQLPTIHVCKGRIARVIRTEEIGVMTDGPEQMLEPAHKDTIMKASTGSENRVKHQMGLRSEEPMLERLGNLAVGEMKAMLGGEAPLSRGFASETDSKAAALSSGPVREFPIRVSQMGFTYSSMERRNMPKLVIRKFVRCFLTSPTLLQECKKVCLPESGLEAVRDVLHMIKERERARTTRKIKKDYANLLDQILSNSITLIAFYLCIRQWFGDWIRKNELDKRSKNPGRNREIIVKTIQELLDHLSPVYSDAIKRFQCVPAHPVESIPLPS